MRCNNCGNELKETDKFCGLCGTPNPDYMRREENLPNPPNPSENTQNTYQSADSEANRENMSQKEKKTAPLWLCILCIVIIFILSIACGALIQLHFGGAAVTITNFFRRITLW